jgi:hypothetical protein
MANPKMAKCQKFKGAAKCSLQLSNDGRFAQRVRKLPTRGSFHGNVSPE